MSTTAYAEWLDTLLEEKGIEPDAYTFVLESGPNMHIIPLEVVVDAIKATSTAESLIIKNTLVMLDFCNQPLIPYFQHLAQAIADASN